MLWKGLWNYRTGDVVMKINRVNVEYAVEWVLDLSHKLRYGDSNYSLCRICCGRGFGPISQATL